MNLSVFVSFVPYLCRPTFNPRNLRYRQSVCLSVCLSVTSRSSIEMVERIELVFDKGASFHPPYTVLKESSGISKNKGTSV